MRLSTWLVVGSLLALLGWESSARADGRPFVDGQRFGLELAVGGGWSVDGTDYTRTLETFGFERWRASRFRFSAAFEGIVLPYFSLLLQTNLLDRQEWNRDSGRGPDDHFNWNTWTLGVHARAFLPLAESFRVYAQFGIGPAFTATRLYVRTTTSNDQTRYREVGVGYHLAGLLGFEVTSTHVGFFLQGGYFHAPSPKNRLGDRHQSGGGVLLVGLSTHFGRIR